MLLFTAVLLIRYRSKMKNNNLRILLIQVASVTKVHNYANATQLLAQTTLRNILGTKTLQEVLSERETIANLMQHHLDEGTEPWGVKVERVEL